MCLIVSTDTKVKIAQEDIVCYKIVKKLPQRVNEPQVYASEFMNFKYELGVLNNLGTSLAICTSSIGKYIVKDGFHSFTFHFDAYFQMKQYLKRFSSRYDSYYDTYCIVRCIIPKGAEYVEGFYNNCQSIVSNKIICKKEV